MAALPKTKMNADEFLAGAEGQEGRLELHDGAVVAMSPEGIVHTRTKGEVFLALRSAILRAGVPCRVYPNGPGLRVNSGNLFEPDAIVACGPPPHDHALEITDPVIVVEVLSTSTLAIDRGLKFEGYFSLPSVERYLILDPERRVVSTTSVARAMSSRPAS
jgi:Uma2 family endonuclease